MQGKFNDTEGGNDGRSSTYQTGLNFNFGNFGIGGVMEYFENGGDDNNAWVAGGGVSYGVDAWTVGLQGSHGTYDGAGAAQSLVSNPGGSRNLNRVILTGNYALGPGVIWMPSLATPGSTIRAMTWTTTRTTTTPSASRVGSKLTF